LPNLKNKKKWFTQKQMQDLIVARRAENFVEITRVLHVSVEVWLQVAALHLLCKQTRELILLMLRFKATKSFRGNVMHVHTRSMQGVQTWHVDNGVRFAQTNGSVERTTVRIVFLEAWQQVLALLLSLLQIQRSIHAELRFRVTKNIPGSVTFARTYLKQAVTAFSITGVHIAAGHDESSAEKQVAWIAYRLASPRVHM